MLQQKINNVGMYPDYLSGFIVKKIWFRLLTKVEIAVKNQVINIEIWLRLVTKLNKLIDVIKDFL